MLVSRTLFVELCHELCCVVVWVKLLLVVVQAQALTTNRSDLLVFFFTCFESTIVRALKKHKQPWGEKNTNTSRIQPLPKLTKITSTFFLCSSPKLAKKRKHLQILTIAEIHKKSLAPFDFDHFQFSPKAPLNSAILKVHKKITSTLRFYSLLRFTKNHKHI
jgi:hypothetical protein